MSRIAPPAVGAHREMQKAFIDRMKATASREGWRYGETLAYFLEAAFRALSRVTLSKQEEVESEAAFQKIIDRCRLPEETRDDFGAMLGMIVLALEADQVDFIGPTFGEIAANEWAGQFFTPPHLSEAIARMTIEDPIGMLKEISPRRFLMISEPACGPGGMVLAAAKVLKEKGINLQLQAHFQMIDVDIRCIHAAYIQTTLCGISADLIHGNTLSLDQWGGWRTFAAHLFPKKIPKEEDQAPPPPAAPSPKLQLNLPL